MREKYVQLTYDCDCDNKRYGNCNIHEDTIHDTVDDAIVYVITRYPGDFRKIECVETRKNIISSLGNTLEFYNARAINRTRIENIYDSYSKYKYYTDDLIDNSGKPSEDLLETIDKLFSMFSDDQSEEMYIHYTDFVHYLENICVKIISTLFPEELKTSFINRYIEIIEHNNKKYYFGGSVGDHGICGFVYNEDKKLIAGVNTQRNPYKYIFTEFFPYVLPSNLKRKIQRYAQREILP